MPHRGPRRYLLAGALVLGLAGSTAPAAALTAERSPGGHEAGGVPASLPRPVRDEPPFGNAAAPNGTTSLVSVSTGGTSGNRPSGGGSWLDRGSSELVGGVSISSDGTRIAFASNASDLVPNDTNATNDVFVRDRTTNTTMRLPYGNGAQLPGDLMAVEPSISADGRWVAYTVRVAPVVVLTAPLPSSPTVQLFSWSSRALPAALAQLYPIVLLFDLASPASATNPAIVSLTNHGDRALGWSPSVSGDGSRVAFVSNATIDGASGGFDQVYVWKRAVASSQMVSRILTGSVYLAGNGNSERPSISGDGLHVAFDSGATNFVSGSVVLIGSRVFVTDYKDASASAPGDPLQVAATARSASISQDGQVLAYVLAPFLVGRAAIAQVYVVDRRSGSWGSSKLVSVATDGSGGNSASNYASISADGRFVAFASAASNLVASDTNAAVHAPEAFWTTPPVTNPVPDMDVFVRDVVRGVTIRASVTSSNGEVRGDSRRPVVSDGGRFIAFDSLATGLVTVDYNKARDVFLRELPPVASATPAQLKFDERPLGSTSPGQAVHISNTGWAALQLGAINVAGSAAGDFAATGSCAAKRLYAGDGCDMTVTFTPSQVGARQASLQIAHNAPSTPATVGLVGAAAQLKVTLDPEVGPPGSVTIVRGGSFPAGALVELTWEGGKEPSVAVKAADGTFVVGVLVFPDDEPGKRTLIVKSSGGPSFPQQTKSFLVTLPTGQPWAEGIDEYAIPGTAPIISRR